jgi:enoyl-CoA hydratase/carnithine racemase
MWQALGEALRAAERDDGVRAIVITGAGAGFSSGADISEMICPRPARSASIPASRAAARAPTDQRRARRGDAAPGAARSRPMQIQLAREG